MQGGGTGIPTVTGTGVRGDPDEREAELAGSPQLSPASAVFVSRLRRHSLAEQRMTPDDAVMHQDDLTTRKRSPSPKCGAEGGDKLPSWPATSGTQSGNGSSAVLPQGCTTVASTLPELGGCREPWDLRTGSAGSPEERALETVR
eukprot:1121418-Rhodomonas_salina.1